MYILGGWISSHVDISNSRLARALDSSCQRDYPPISWYIIYTIYKTSEFSWRRETPPVLRNFFHIQSLAGSLPADNNERTRRRVRVKLFYFPRRPFSLRSLHSLFSANSSHRVGSFPALTAKKVLATVRHSFNLRITKRYTRQIPGLVLWRSYLHFSQGITVLYFTMCTFSARQFHIMYTE